MKRKLLSLLIALSLGLTACMLSACKKPDPIVEVGQVFMGVYVQLNSEEVGTSYAVSITIKEDGKYELRRGMLGPTAAPDNYNWGAVSNLAAQGSYKIEKEGKNWFITFDQAEFLSSGNPFSWTVDGVTVTATEQVAAQVAAGKYDPFYLKCKIESTEKETGKILKYTTVNTQTKAKAAQPAEGENPATDALPGTVALYVLTMNMGIGPMQSFKITSVTFEVYTPAA
jgi:hypothetical protein